MSHLGFEVAHFRFLGVYGHKTMLTGGIAVAKWFGGDVRCIGCECKPNPAFIH
jgi:hypothetical protein